MTQVIMLTSASGVNKKRLEKELADQRKSAERRASQSTDPTDDVADDVPLFKGKPIDQLNSAEYAKYMAS
jgi:hypothetical protein